MTILKKHVYIAYTGGTIGMQRMEAGHYEPVPNSLQTLMADNPAFNHPDLPQYEVHAYEPLLDSPNMTPGDWSCIAQDICQNYAQYDGFVVLHGTDTMTYTASALAFLLDGLAKPVIVTGSQIPLCEIRNDAQENLITSLILAATCEIPEVCLYFNGRLFRGCRIVKTDSIGFDAFESPNYPPLAKVGIEVELNHRLINPSPKKRKTINLKLINDPSNVATFRIFPGMTTDILNSNDHGGALVVCVRATVCRRLLRAQGVAARARRRRGGAAVPARRRARDHQRSARHCGNNVFSGALHGGCHLRAAARRVQQHAPAHRARRCRRRWRACCARCADTGCAGRCGRIS